MKHSYIVLAIVARSYYIGLIECATVTLYVCVCVSPKGRRMLDVLLNLNI